MMQQFKLLVIFTAKKKTNKLNKNCEEEKKQKKCEVMFI